MNKTLLYAIGGVVIIGVAAGAFMMKSPDASPAANEEVVSQSDAKSMKDLMASEEPQKCTFTQDVESVKTTGVAYVGGGKMRTDFTAVTQGMTVKSHMIAEGNVAYTWGDGAPFGIKIAFNDLNAEMSAKPQGMGLPDTGTPDIYQKLDYSCESWKVDAALFTPPSNIKFNDMNEMIKGMNIEVEGGGNVR